MLLSKNTTIKRSKKTGREKRGGGERQSDGQTVRQTSRKKEKERERERKRKRERERLINHYDKRWCCKCKTRLPGDILIVLDLYQMAIFECLQYMSRLNTANFLAL